MKTSCDHCGVGFRPTNALERFCCNGCETVSGLIQKEGLEDFYKLRDAPGRPIGELSRDDFQWARMLQVFAEKKAVEESVAFASLTVSLDGMTCAGCVWLVELLYERTRGSHAIQLSLSQGTMSMSWRLGEFELDAFLKHLANYGYRGRNYKAGWGQSFSVRTWQLLISALFALNATFMNWLSLKFIPLSEAPVDLFQILYLAFYGICIFVGGSYFVQALYVSFQNRVLSTAAILVAPILLTLSFGQWTYLPWLLVALLGFEWILSKRKNA